MPVDTLHPEYKRSSEDWMITEACVKGKRALLELKTKVLPAPGEVDGVYDENRYKAYQTRAIYTNFTGRTLYGLRGAAFRKAPTIELSPQLEYMEEDADGAGQSLFQFSKAGFDALMKTGRDVLLADYPPVEPGLTIEQVNEIGARAFIKRYTAADLINWNTQTVGGMVILTMAVLREAYDASDDEFAKAPKDQYRVLRLTAEGYSQQVYRDGEPVTEPIFPRQFSGKAFDFIPLFVAGSQTNGLSVDMIPLLDIAHVNMGHFRNSADMEEAAFIAGQPTLHIDIGDTDAASWKELNGDKVELGSRRAIQTQKGRVELVQAEERNIYTDLMEKKEGQMMALGAKLVEKRNPNETAAAAKIDATGENSVLADIVTNLEEAINKCVEWCGLFMGAQTESSIEFSREFFPDSVDPGLISSAIQLADRAVIAKTDLRTIARRAQLIEDGRTDEEIDGEAEMADPMEGNSKQKFTNDKE